MIPVRTFRAKKRNGHAQILAGRQAPSLKKWREFRRSRKQKKKKKITYFLCFPILLVGSNNLTSPLEDLPLDRITERLSRATYSPPL